MTEILMLAYDYLDELRTRTEYREYLELTEKIEQLYTEDLERISKLKQQFDEINETGGKYHPDFTNISQAYSKEKTRIFELKEIKRYLEINQMFEEEINELLKEVSMNISENIPVFNKFGFIKNKGVKCHGC